MRQLENSDTKQAVTMVAGSDTCMVHQPHVKRGCELPAEQNLYMPFKNGLKLYITCKEYCVSFQLHKMQPVHKLITAPPPPNTHSLQHTHYTLFFLTSGKAKSLSFQKHPIAFIRSCENATRIRTKATSPPKNSPI